MQANATRVHACTNGERWSSSKTFHLLYDWKSHQSLIIDYVAANWCHGAHAHTFNYSRDRSLDDKPDECERKVLFCLFLLHFSGKEICHEKKIADLGGLWHLDLMRERISMILTLAANERVNVCLNLFSPDIRKDFRSPRFSLLMIEYFRCARTSSASFRFSFLENIYDRKSEREAGERDFHRTASALSADIKWKMQKRMNWDSHLVTRINGQEAIAVITCGSRFKLFSSLCFGSGSLFMSHKRSCC